MPKRLKMRRFEPRYGISSAMVEEEARWLRHEADDSEVLSVADLERAIKERQWLRLNPLKVRRVFGSAIGIGSLQDAGWKARVRHGWC
jgi:predicted anti-sigma-YlaC factor YlaD